MNYADKRFLSYCRSCGLVRIALIGVASIIGIGGCGGGGGGGGGGGSIGPTAEISSTTAPDISGTTVESVILVSSAVADAPILGGGGGIASASLGTSKKAESTLMVDIPATTEPCPFGGSITVSGNIGDPDLLIQGVLLPGDSLISDFNSCDFGLDLIFNGGFDLTVNSFSGDIFDLFFDMDFNGDFKNFGISSDGSTFQIDGQFDTSIVSTTFPVVTVIASSPRLDISVNPGGFAATLFDYSESSTTDASGFPEICTTDASGSLQSSEFTGEVEFVTTEVFSGDCFDNPSSGAALITGADGATINLIVIDSNNVELHIDLDADGIVDEVQAKTWDELLPLGL